ncbi:DUF2384 domain-containing protein [Sphingosinicella sp. BN140058]|nr:DUF2384 domain-containing protein [Sphingosinicella sp. BN140058]
MNGVQQDRRSPDYLTVLTEATRVFGSREAAQTWMITPALGLDGRCPTDLVRNADGLTKVRLFLQRIEYGVYT